MVGHYTVSPALPPGLSLDGQSGVISATPTLTSESAIYMVNASGAGVRASFPLVLSVTEPPNHLSYPSPVAGTAGTPLGQWVPTVTGSVEHYAVTPALPREWRSIARAASLRVRPPPRVRWPLIRSRRAVRPAIRVSFSCWQWLRHRSAATNEWRQRSLPDEPRGHSRADRRLPESSAQQDSPTILTAAGGMQK